MKRSATLSNFEKGLILKGKRKDILCKSGGADPTHLAWKQVRENLGILAGRHEKTFIRGKYHLWFFINIIKNLTDKTNQLINVHNTLRPPGQHIALVSANGHELTEATIFDLVAHQINIPSDINIFLTLNKAKLS